MKTMFTFFQRIFFSIIVTIALLSCNLFVEDSNSENQLHQNSGDEESFTDNDSSDKNNNKRL